MIIQMVYQMSGGRYDDRAWPQLWTDFEVPDEEGRGLVACGAAVFVADSAAPPPPAVEQVTELASAPASAAADDTAAEPRQDLPATAPSATDPKAAWVEHAVSQGANLADAQNMTKNQLQVSYGGRL